MNYYVNGELMNRKELVAKVLEICIDLGEEKGPVMAYLRNYPIEVNVERHACGIARSLGWSVVKIWEV